MGNLLSLKFWFDLRPDPMLSGSQKIFIGVVFILVISFLLFWFLKSKKKGLFAPFFNRLYLFSVVNAFMGLIIWFFNYELIPFLSARFWFLLWGISMIVWLVFIFKDLRKIPARKKQLEEEKEFKKYIP